MSKPEDLEILQVAEDVFEYGYTALRRFPKSERFTLAADIKREMILIVSLIIRANEHKDEKRRDFIFDLCVEIEILRTLVRESYRLGFLPKRQNEHLAKLINEVGKRAGGWKKKPF